MLSFKIAFAALIAVSAISMLAYPVMASDCSGFGSIPHTSQAVRVKPGSYNYISISFFNCKDEDLLVELSVDNLPKGWWVDIESEKKTAPNTIYLESQEPTKTPTGGGSWFILSDGSTYIKTVSVRLKIGTPSDIWGGLYRLKFSAFASPVEKNNGEGFSIVPKFGREFNFDIEVPAPYRPQASDDSAKAENTASSVPNEKNTDVFSSLESKIDAKKQDESYEGKEDVSIIQGGDEIKETVPSKGSGDGITSAFTVAGMKGSTIIIIAIIILVILSLLYYLRS